ncbi:hypothetical protein FO519_009897 [Halicephalobus sp. NKZ332]|nr:hypothetical protein FO519_009897 [Halicephalobus sp. NKZ332]
MTLNQDLYYELFWEIISPYSDCLKHVSVFIFSGKEPLTFVKTFMKRVESVKMSRWEYVRDKNRLVHPDMVDLRWKNGICSHTDIRYPSMELFVRWILSSVKRFEICSKDPFRKKVMELLSENPNFTELEIHSCDLSIANRLLESRRFNYIRIGFSYSDWKKIHIDTKEVEFEEVNLQEILELKSVKTNSLITTQHRIQFNDILLPKKVELV